MNKINKLLNKICYIYLKIKGIVLLFALIFLYLFDDNSKETVFIEVIVLLYVIVHSILSKILESEEGSEYRKFLINEIEQEDNLSNKEKNDEKIKDNNEENIETKKSDKKDILIQMLNNNDEITDYFKISKRQAQSSFWFSIIACIIGIVAICLSLYAVFEIKDMKFAIVSIAGGTITELIAGTVLVIHNKSALQLNYYYDALHENEKFLSAINLAEKLDDYTKRQIYIEIIKKQIGIERKDKKEVKDTDENNSN